MTLFRVTIAQTCFTSYLVEADSKEAAGELQGARPKLWKEGIDEDWADEGYGDDAELLRVEEMR